MLQDLKEAWAWFPGFVNQLFSKGGRGLIHDHEAVTEFVSTRAAFIAQKTLYGYVKTRMGTSHPKMFSDDTYIRSVNIAKMHVFAACLSDLSLFTAWHLLRGRMVTVKEAEALALAAYLRGLGENEAAGDPEDPFDSEEAVTLFKSRLKSFDWHTEREAPALFTASPAALFKWAPIAPELKKRDRVIVYNSIRFAWREIRGDFVRRLKWMDREDQAAD
ncbi:hypothetical protein [Aestuariispira insulae]|uniref:Uncharacterized protein n=1 Tax=Aestuariispira insulae TaxID=1461337 RepID=A0A3D9H1I0_9PROT|nr:hypothetical protein [Aestuariispira insulae]RED43363.1 hypothetical protein DFP90_1236 [Aestuariispira insulae]